MAAIVAKKPVGILSEIVAVGKKPGGAVPAEADSSPDMGDDDAEDTLGASPEEREALGSTLASALKGGDGAALYDAVEAIVRSCKGSY